jgi:hypothetical protein
MGFMFPNCFSNVKNQQVREKNTILNVEDDLEQCAHIFQKKG